jgi:dephospho-CoA kinase
MNKNLNLIQTIINEFGEDSYINGDLNREKFINLLFSDDTSRMKMNSIVHPFMKTDFNEWCEIWKNEDYILFESAILFDTEDKMEMDFNILVVADMDIRIERVQKRNSFTVENVMERINSQSSDEFKTQFADCVITNNDKEETTKQIIEVHKIIMSL